MFRTCQDDLDRPADLADPRDPTALYTRSYLIIRAVVGVIGILLPIVFILGETFFLRAGVRVRGSISAYYHTSMRDLFVGGLTVIGFMLLTYMAGRKRRPDWWLSSVAGVAVLGVAYFPTNRPQLTDGAARCGVTPEPAGCSPIQQALGETLVATIHFVCAAIFISCLAGISFYFACRAGGKGSARVAQIHRTCGYAILAALAWIALGGVLKVYIGPLTPLYVGEIVSVWAFSVSWLIAARDLLPVMMPKLAQARTSGH
ncbi:MAG TPA: hypothetical protein VI357_24785 [Mycobacteriales bacterium]